MESINPLSSGISLRPLRAAVSWFTAARLERRVPAQRRGGDHRSWQA